MRVLKRNGDFQEVSFDKILARVRLLCCDPNLKILEIEELITKDYDEYKNKIISLIDNEKRQSMKNLIKNKLQTSKLLDVNYFTKNFEKIILDAISKRC